MLTLVSKDSVKNSDHFDVLCVLIACMVLEIINQMSKNQKSSLIVWNTVCLYCSLVPKPFPPPVFDHILYAKTEGEGLGERVMYVTSGRREGRHRGGGDRLL